MRAQHEEEEGVGRRSIGISGGAISSSWLFAGNIEQIFWNEYGVKPHRYWGYLMRMRFTFYNIYFSNFIQII